MGTKGNRMMNTPDAPRDDAPGAGFGEVGTVSRSSSDRPLPGAMTDRLPETAPAPDFDAKSTAKKLLRTVRAGALATIDRNTGHPFGSLVNVATDSDGSPLMLISRLSSHTANLEADTKASVLLATAGKGDPLAHPRLTVLGRFAAIANNDPDEARLRRRFLARHPKAELYAGFADFALWRMSMESAHLVAGFGRATNLAAADVATDVTGTRELLAAEASAIAHLNDDHADAIALYAIKLLGAAAGPWRVTGLDPEGLDLACGDAVLRLEFAGRVTTAGQLREVLANLAKQARGS
jgi:heme oxygenase (biliverdin-IX-beta and delta-forming)